MIFKVFRACFSALFPSFSGRPIGTIFSVTEYYTINDSLDIRCGG